MKVLIEIKNGSVIYTASNCKDVVLQVVDHDSFNDKPDYWEKEAENLGTKGLKEYIGTITESESI